MCKFRNKTRFNHKKKKPPKELYEVNEFPLHLSLFSLIVQYILKKRRDFTCIG